MVWEKERGAVSKPTPGPLVRARKKGREAHPQRLEKGERGGPLCSGPLYLVRHRKEKRKGVLIPQIEGRKKKVVQEGENGACSRRRANDGGESIKSYQPTLCREKKKKRRTISTKKKKKKKESSSGGTSVVDGKTDTLRVCDRQEEEERAHLASLRRREKEKKSSPPTPWVLPAARPEGEKRAPRLRRGKGRKKKTHSLPSHREGFARHRSGPKKKKRISDSLPTHRGGKEKRLSSPLIRRQGILRKEGKEDYFGKLRREEKEADACSTPMKISSHPHLRE